MDLYQHIQFVFGKKNLNKLNQKFLMEIEDIMMKISINILKKIKYLLKDKGMTLNGVKKVLNSENSDIDELIQYIYKTKKYY